MHIVANAFFSRNFLCFPDMRQDTSVNMVLVRNLCSFTVQNHVYSKVEERENALKVASGPASFLVTV